MLITIDDKELEQFIDRKLDERENKSKKPLYCDEWKELREEIDQYCHNGQSINRSYQTLQNFIYSAIKFTTGVSRVADITTEQANIARDTFEFLKQKRIECKLNEKYTDYLKQFNKEANF
ncbi:hypothetical protein AB9M75_08005 [Lactobacillus sp. AN1001]